MSTRPLPNARFWTWINGQTTKVTLRPGQSLSHYQWERTDEGWSSEFHSWEYTDNLIRRYCVSDGRDCDGRLTQEQVAECPVVDLASGYSDLEERVRYPEWTEEGRSQRDEYAEAMGY